MNLAEKVYRQLKEDIFDFRMLPGDRFSESEVAERMQDSRTPVREALYRLERDGYVQVYFRNGWQVRPFDFRYFEELYDVRILLECEVVRRLCMEADRAERLAGLVTIWCCKPSQRQVDPVDVAFLDEEFHFGLLECGQNKQMEAIHKDVCERLRIVRRLDFYEPGRIQATYDEHSSILSAILSADSSRATRELTRHIEVSRNTVREITVHRIQEARQRYSTDLSRK